MGAPLFTVFTPTFDRARTLHRVRESLERQTFRDFEWVVCDDGSTDDTAELLDRWSREIAIPMRVERQENAGKHVAIRRGIEAARGALFLIHDADDGCVPEALELRYRYRVGGERWGFVRTELLRRFPFPDRPVRTYVPESLVWDRIGRDHRTRFVDEPLRIYHVDAGADSIAHGRHPARNAPGSFLQYEAVLNEQLGWFRSAPGAFVRAAAYFVRFGLHAGHGLPEQRRRLRSVAAQALWLAALPLGYAAWMRDGNEA